MEQSDPLKPAWQRQLLFTHCPRPEQLFEQSLSYAQKRSISGHWVINVMLFTVMFMIS